MSEFIRIGDIPGLGSEYSYSKEDGFRLLRERGAVKAEVQFSGGNDEGGADLITLTLADESTVLIQGPTWVYEDGTVNEYADGKHTNRPATDEEKTAAKLWETLEAPLNYKYGSWAGEFSVSGVLTWDVEAGTVEEAGEQSSYEGYSDAF